MVTYQLINYLIPLGSLEPLAAVLKTVFWLSEPFGFFQWVGTVCIIGLTLLLALNKNFSSKTNKTAKID